MSEINRCEFTTADLPADVEAWASEVAGGTGEEGEHTLYDDPDEPDLARFVQVWADDDGQLPLVGFFASPRFEGECDWRHDFSPDRALELAAMLITQALAARQRAANIALWAEEHGERDAS